MRHLIELLSEHPVAKFARVVVPIVTIPLLIYQYSEIPPWTIVVAGVILVAFMAIAWGPTALRASQRSVLGNETVAERAKRRWRWPSRTTLRGAKAGVTGNVYSETAPSRRKKEQIECPVCKGKGIMPGYKSTQCDRCRGRTYIYTYRIGQPSCSICNGTGVERGYKSTWCGYCNGVGLMPYEEDDRDEELLPT